MVTTRAQLHDLVDRLPEYALEGAPNGRPIPPAEIVRVLRDLNEMTRVIWAVASRMAERQAPLGAPPDLSFIARRSGGMSGDRLGA